MSDRIQAAVQAEVEAQLARLRAPASNAVPATPLVSAPSAPAVSHPGKQLFGKRSLPQFFLYCLA